VLFKINQVLNLQKNKKFYQNALRISVIFAIIWLILSPHFTLANIIICIIASMASSLIFMILLKKNVSNKMLQTLTAGFIFKKDFYLYTLFITKEIISSSLHILKTGLVLRKFADEIIEITLPNNISAYRTFLVVISITITPGTSVVGVNGSKLMVHCLTQHSKNSLNEMTFIHKVLSFKF
jgi:multisubunit Na+/H+ antiporter MnhE subunit